MTSHGGTATLVSGGTGGRPVLGDPTRLDRTARRISRVLLVLLIVVIAVIVFWPGPPDPDGQNWLMGYLDRAHYFGLPRWISFDFIQNASNVVMFVPLGLLGSLSLRRHNYLVVVFAGLSSGFIELVQLVLLPGRFASVEDIVCNTVGALIGFLLSIPALRRRIARRRRYVQGRRSAADSPRRAARAARI